VGFLGIYLPGIVLKFSILTFWRKIRTNKWFMSFLKGVECGAVGLVFTAVYRIGRMGYVSDEFPGGSPVDNEPWFVLIGVASFVANKWFNVQPPVAIISGGILGMLWYAAVGS
jgi:chromate transport protein ChrA